MSEIRLALGPVVFSKFELPTEITFGGRQRLAVHRLADGRRVVDCLGRDEGQIVFSGIFSGTGAATRARMLDQFRGQGVVLPLSWDSFFIQS